MATMRVRLSTVFARADSAYVGSGPTVREAAAADLGRACAAEGLEVVGRCTYCRTLRPTATLCSHCGAECAPVSVAVAVAQVRAGISGPRID